MRAALLTLLVASCAFVAAPAPSARTGLEAPPTRPLDGREASLLVNGGFESGVASPAGWAPAWWDGAPAPTVGWSQEAARTGARGVRVAASVPTDARWEQAVAVEPGATYRLAGWVRTENVAVAESYVVGASLSVLGGFEHTPALVGTHGWTYVALEFAAGSRTEVVICARLGFYSGTATGTAWFDDVSLTRLGGHAAEEPVVAWGANVSGQTTVPAGLDGATAVASGRDHALALRADGTVAGWGYNVLTQATPPPGLDDVVAVAAGWFHSLALRSDGTVIGWGGNFSGQVTLPAGLSDVVAIAGGGSHSLALRADGSVVGWGSDVHGQATPPAGLDDVAAVAAGGGHSLALRSNGTVVAWGLGTRGQTTPPPGLSGVVAVAAGDEYSLALRSDGTVVAWGNNENGQATPPAGLSDVVAISAGIGHALAVREDGSVVGWGWNGTGQAVPPPGLPPVAAVAAGYEHSVALLGSPLGASPLVVSFGPVRAGTTSPSRAVTVRNDRGTDRLVEALAVTGPDADAFVADHPDLPLVLGPGESLTVSVAFAPAAVGPQTADLVVAGGGATATVALAGLGTPALTAGVAAGWGDDASGQATPPAGTGDLVAVAAGRFHTLGLRPDGTVVGWGRDAEMQATPPAGLTGVVAIEAGASHSLALRADGTVRGWGIDLGGAASPPGGLADVVAIAAGIGHSLALRADGTVVGWGSDIVGQSTPPPGLSDVVAVAAGHLHSLALRSDGTVVVWGSDAYGQASPPVGLASVVAIAAGEMFSLALRSDGTVVAWGRNDEGQTALPAGLDGVVAVAAGDAHGLALRAGGEVVGWGYDAFGQASPPPGLGAPLTIGAGRLHSVALLSHNPGLLVAAPAALDFGTVSVGSQSAAQTVTVRNDGGSPVEVPGVALGGDHGLDFVVVDNPAFPLTLAPGATFEVDLTFAPTLTGPRSGALVFDGTSEGQVLTVGLTGAGGPPPAGGDFALTFEPARGDGLTTTTTALNGAAFTVEAWVTTDARPEGFYPNSVVSRDAPGFNGDGFGVWTRYDEDAGQWVGRVLVGYDAGFREVYVTGIEPGDWHHYAVVKASDPPGVEYRVYVDGARVARFSAPASTPNGEALRIGFHGDAGWGSARFHAGWIDEVRVWQAARTDAEVFAAYDRRLDGDEAGLVHLWRFDEGAGAMATSAAPLGGNAVAQFVGAPTWTGPGAPVGTKPGLSVVVDGPRGHRYFGPPAPGVTVPDLAAQNLVRGVPGFFPEAEPTLWTAYDAATGTWTPPAAGETLTLGRAFRWYLLDRDGVGDLSTSVSRAHPFVLTTPRPPNAADVAVRLDTEGSRFNVLANPFGTGLDLAGYASWPGANGIRSALYVYDPATAAWSPAPDVIGPWEAFRFRAAGPRRNGKPRNLVIPAAARVPAGPARREASRPAGPALSFRLEGLDAAGRPLADRMLTVAFADTSSAAFSADEDVEKFQPPATAYALLGARVSDAFLGHDARPFAPAEVPLGLEARGAASAFTLSWDASALPAGLPVTLVDLETGLETDVRRASAYAFEAPSRPALADVPLRDLADGAEAVDRFVLRIGGALAAAEPAPALSLEAPRPTPTAGAARVAFSLPARSAVRVAVFDVRGRHVALLAGAPFEAGRHEVEFDASGLASGVYVVRLEADGAVLTTRAVVVR